ncbi:hypothetical protein OHB49_02670 [Streptomyces sp. NBC_01717]|uniref:hypothetical protein n=1 Tax=Streptomyces sp. NBC_01717 TaxID=2975918 RepID=UPI002E370C50|nr:hypothetical protein [Streptomyces sp. NBC_01717]
MAVIDRPPIDERTLTAEVAQAWGLDGVELVFLPIGLDGQAWAYRINTAGEDGYFMKVRRGEFAPAAVSLPQYLREQGLTHVVAPRGTRSGEAGHAMGGYRMLLYPFHGGGNPDRPTVDRVRGVPGQAAQHCAEPADRIDPAGGELLDDRTGEGARAQRRGGGE